MLTPEEVRQLKQQLLDQVRNLPDDRRSQVETQIEAMSPESLETMLNQQRQGMPKTANKPVFRMIVDSDIPSKKIDESKEAIAVLDIRPISNGHTIIIPKTPITNSKGITTSIFSFAKRVANKIMSKLKAKNVEIQTEEKFGEIILNIIPIYNKPLNINSPRIDESEDNLNKVYDILSVHKVEKIEKIKKERIPKIQSETLKLPRRIP